MKRKDIVIGGQYVLYNGTLVEVTAVMEPTGAGEYLWKCHGLYPDPIKKGTYRMIPGCGSFVRSSTIKCTIANQKRLEAHRERLTAARQNKLDKASALAKEIQQVLVGVAERSAGECPPWISTKGTKAGEIVVTLSPHAASCLLHRIGLLKEASKDW